MKRLLALSLMLPLAGIAAPPSPAASAAAAQTAARTAASDAAVQQQMADLQARMGELAQRMAALSTRIGNEASASALRYLADSRRGMLGMAVDDRADGMHVEAVTPGGPAERAGLKNGDLITAINGKPLPGNDDDDSLLDELQPGKSVRVTILRDGKPLHLQATPERWQSDDWRATVRAAEHAAREASARVNSPEFKQHLQQQIDDAMREASRARKAAIEAGAHAGTWRVFAPLWGLNLAPLNPGLGRYFGTDQGALVLSRDAKRYPELESGDVITRVGGHAVASPHDAMRAFRDAPDDKPVTLAVRRHDKSLALTLKSPPRWLAIPPPPPAPPVPPTPPAPPAPFAPPAPPTPPPPASAAPIVP